MSDEKKKVKIVEFTPPRLVVDEEPDKEPEVEILGLDSTGEDLAVEQEVTQEDVNRILKEIAGSDCPSVGDIVTNEQGGKGSLIRGKMSEVPPLALIAVSEVMATGASRYPRETDGTPNWYRVSIIENCDHAGEHLVNFFAEVNKPTLHQSESRQRSPRLMREELSHAAARIMMAMEQFERKYGCLDG